MNPGSNLLKRALRIINKQTVSYYAYVNRSTNATGNIVPVYADPINIIGSFQTVPRNRYEMYGLDFNKSYATFYTSVQLLDLQRDIAGDRIRFNERLYQCESSNDWYAIDGWNGVLCVYIREQNA